MPGARKKQARNMAGRRNWSIMRVLMRTPMVS